jgi:hypothetical protein
MIVRVTFGQALIVQVQVQVQVQFSCVHMNSYDNIYMHMHSPVQLLVGCIEIAYSRFVSLKSTCTSCHPEFYIGSRIKQIWSSVSAEVTVHVSS